MDFLRIRLGDLEVAVLRYLWSNDRQDVKSTYDALGVARGISLNTVQSALERLYRKKLAARQKVGRSFVYSAAVSKRELIADLIEDMVVALGNEREDSMLPAFVDLATRSDGEDLQRLERLIQQRRKEVSSAGVKKT